MGLGASEVRFLALTARKADLEYSNIRLENRKVRLMDEMDNISKDYQLALSSKSLMFSNNKGMTYSEISYGIFMQPGAANGNNPILISDSAGRIVLNDKYKQYAERISSDGSPGGKWDGETKVQILSELTGIPIEQFEKSNATSAEASNKRTALNDAEKAITQFKDTKIKGFDAKHLVNTFLKDLENDSTTVDSSNIESYASKFTEALIGKNYFSSKQEETIKKTIDGLCNATSFQDMNEDIKNSYKVSDLAKDVAGAIIGGLTGENNREDEQLLFMYDAKTGQGTQAEYDALVAARDAAKADYDAAVGVDAQVFNGTQDIQIQFYDRLFAAIAELGWVNDSGVEDSTYLSEMLQNNSYYITTMTKNDSYDPEMGISNKNTPYYYSTNIASNYDNLYPVNNTAVRDEALAKYEYEKSRINRKEKMIDTQIDNNDTELQAILKMMEVDEKIKNDNIERTYKVFA